MPRGICTTGGGRAHRHPLRELRLRTEDQKIEPAAQQHDHFPLLAVQVRTHVAVRFERNQQALNLILRIGVQKDMRAPSRARGRRVCELRQFGFGNEPWVFGFPH